MINQNTFKSEKIKNISNLRIVSMIPGDRKVAGCFYVSNNFRGFYGRYNNFC